jgi:hypothetical protein
MRQISLMNQTAITVSWNRLSRRRGAGRTNALASCMAIAVRRRQLHRLRACHFCAIQTDPCQVPVSIKEVPMFDAVSIPFGAKMLFNTLKLKPGVSFDDVELAVGELCNVVKKAYGGDKGGFIAGQVFKFSGFVSDEGSLTASRAVDDHIAIVTYWSSFEEHEKSHADELFNSKFSDLAKMCSDIRELGYDILWQGEA